MAGLVDEIGIVALINEQLGEHSSEKISAGQVVKGMILNGLGLVSSPLYLFSRFFEGDEDVLTAEEMLSKYKGQQAVERGFRFLKDPMFLTNSVFLKSPERIESLGLIMGLCLLVYTLDQRQLRQTLQCRQSKIPNQLGRLTDRPSLRWLFQCFQSIHVLVVRQSVEISNLTDERLSLLKFFPPACQRYYLLS